MSLLITLAVIVPIGVALAIFFLVYIIGNVYNGFVRRRAKVETSWHELSKLIKRCYGLLPSMIRTVRLSESQKSEMTEIYRACQTLDADASVSALAELDHRLWNLSKTLNIDRIPSWSKVEKDLMEFYLAERRSLDFSIPLYNSNVRDYERFRRMPVNRIFAKWFHFQPKSYFLTSVDLATLQARKGKER